jgi:hypothetical protein
MTRDNLESNLTVKIVNLEFLLDDCPFCQVILSLPVVIVIMIHGLFNIYWPRP